MTTASPRWMKITLYMAGIYNIVWGTVVVLFPQALFELAGMQPPHYPALFQCIGMMIAVFGVAYLCAATDPVRHWPVILAGLLGRLLGPIGFVIAFFQGQFTLYAGITILTNDIIWWVPFIWMLWIIYHIAR